MNKNLLYVVLGVVGLLLFVGYQTKVAKTEITFPVLKQIQDFMGGVPCCDCGDPNCSDPDCKGACPGGVCPPGTATPGTPGVRPNPPNLPPGTTPPTSVDEKEYTYKDAMTQATIQDKKVFVVFHATWCSPCKELAKTLKDPKVMDALHPFVRSRVDVDQDKVSTALHRVRGVPAYFILDANGKVIKKGSGFKDVTSFLEWLKS
jgi:thioredoxin 1